MNIYQLPVRSDNYIFVLHSAETGTAAVVDPADAPPVLAKLEELNAELVAIFNTHHHNDHVGGNKELIKRFPKAEVYASEADRGRIPMQTYALNEGDRVSFAGHDAKVFFVPGHTSGHIAYYFASRKLNQPGELFCGDTLFAGGCGRLFEGTPEQMQHSLAKLRNLPDNTRVWCAHEYTLSNLRFAISVDHQNEALMTRLAEVKRDRAQDKPTVPTMLGIEKSTNPFLRWDASSLQSVAGEQEPAAVFAHVRKLKDNF